MRSNYLQNGEFLGNLNEWVGAGTINHALGYPRAGCVALAAGQSISQAVQIGEDQLYTLHYFYRLGSDAIPTVSYGAISQTHTGAPNDVWREGVLAFALDEAAADSIAFAAAGGTVYIDSVTLIVGGLPVTRAELAARIADSLGGVATEAAFSAVPSALGSEGDYTYAIDDALRGIGARNLYGDPDVAQVEAAAVNDVIRSARNAMLRKAQGDFAMQTDVSLGPRRESFSQRTGAIDKLLSGEAADRRVQTGRLIHR